MKMYRYMVHDDSIIPWLFLVLFIIIFYSKFSLENVSQGTLFLVYIYIYMQCDDVEHFKFDFLFSQVLIEGII